MNKIQFDNLIKPLIKIYDEIELDIIRNLLERLSDYSKVSGSLDWYLEKLADLGTIDKDILKILKKDKNRIEKVLKEIINKASSNIDNLNTLNEYYEKGLIDVNPNELYKSTSINNLVNEALKDTDSIMSLINTKAIEGAKETYKEVLNKAYIETASGVYTYTESIRRALDDMAREGIKIVHYESGKSYSIESVVRRDVITRVNKLVGDCEIEHAKMLGTNLVYVDQHLGARVRTKYTKEDYEAHAEWQGKKYMIEGSNDEYDNLYEKTGYGEMLGLKGINCYHNLRPTWEWEEIPDRVDEIENAKEYENLQTQRTFERKLRKLKRQKLIAKSTFDNESLTKINKQIKFVDKEFNEFLKENNLTRDYSREYVSEKNVLFEDNIIEKDFQNLDNSVEHLIIYDLNTEKKLLQVSSDSSNSVGSLKAVALLKTSKVNSLVAVHNHPSNSSFSFTDMETFNNNKSLNLIIVKTDKYLYYLEKNGINKIKMKQLKKMYNDLYQENVRIYGKNIETRHITNEIFAKEIGWRYGRK